MPGRNRGTWSSKVSFLGNWSYPVCSLIAMSIAPIFMADINWRVQFVIPSVLSLIATLIAIKKFPESPRWLESQGKYDEAERVMSSIEKAIEKETGKKLESVFSEGIDKAEKTIPFSDLFKGTLLKRVILGSFVLIAMNVVQYTLINWLPTIFLTQG